MHFTAESHVDRSITGPAAFLQTNIMGTFTLLEVARQYWFDKQTTAPQACRFLHVSTDEVYGSLTSNMLAFTEQSAYAPNSPYSASLASSDHFVRAYYHTYGLPTIISNCSNNYGSYQHQDKFIPTIISACLQREPISVHGDGSNIRDWLYVEDHCQALALILQHGELGEQYNIGANNEISNLDLVKQICQLLNDIKPADRDYAELIEFVIDRAGHDWRYAIDNSKVVQQLGWQPKTVFQEGLQRTIEYYLLLTR